MAYKHYVYGKNSYKQGKYISIKKIPPFPRKELTNKKHSLRGKLQNSYCQCYRLVLGYQRSKIKRKNIKNNQQAASLRYSGTAMSLLCMVKEGSPYFGKCNCRPTQCVFNLF